MRNSEKIQEKIAELQDTHHLSSLRSELMKIDNDRKINDLKRELEKSISDELKEKTHKFYDLGRKNQKSILSKIIDRMKSL